MNRVIPVEVEVTAIMISVVIHNVAEAYPRALANSRHSKDLDMRLKVELLENLETKFTSTEVVLNNLPVHLLI